MKAFVGAVTTIGVVLYPVGVWIGLTRFSARTVSLWMLALLVPSVLYRFRGAKREDLWAVLRIPAVIIAVLAVGALLDDRRFVVATPVLINVGLLVNFAASLRGVPMIERFARLHTDEPLGPAHVAHCRQATLVWIAFFLFNAVTATVLASRPAWTEAWAAYNGGIAYALMGAVALGEYVVRRYRFREFGSGAFDRALQRVFPEER
ncbi:MAG TPA: hypothetical protein ENK57_13995 [Polyangiaceae bacterium]|nr:hypothetical protein [Polyangiaceae bacterium]